MTLTAESPFAKEKAKLDLAVEGMAYATSLSAGIHGVDGFALALLKVMPETDDGAAPVVVKATLEWPEFTVETIEDGEAVLDDLQRVGRLYVKAVEQAVELNLATKRKHIEDQIAVLRREQEVAP